MPYKNTYLTHMEFDEVVDSVTPSDHTNIKYVEIVEVIDQDGNPWDPEPGPDPWEDLVVVEASRYSNLNDYTAGSEVFAHVASFTGGTENNIYRYRWSYKEADSDTWNQDSWTAYNNNSVLETSFLIPSAAIGGQVRFQSQARDNSVDPINSANSYTSPKNVATLPLAGTPPTLEGLPYVGQRIYCPTPVVTGGKPPYEYNYFWMDRDPAKHVNNFMSQSTTLVNYDLGKMVRCQVTVTDAEGTKVFADSNEIGPVLAAPQMEPVTQMLNGNIVSPNEGLEVPAGTVTLQIIPHNTPNDIQFNWTLRSGDGTLTQDPASPDIATYTTGENDFAPMIACTMTSDIAEEDHASGSWQLLVT